MFAKSLVLVSFLLVSGVANASHFDNFNAPQNACLAGPSSGGAGTSKFRALVGADLPNPSSSTLGGVESITSVAHNFLTSISTSGVPAQAQPACADLSNAAASCSTDTTNAANISSGALALARGGTHADLSATGGAHQVLRQSSSGADVTVGQLAATDISGLTGQVNVTIKTTTYTAACNDAVYADATGGAFTVTLPSAATANCEVKVVKVDSSANAITISKAGADTITGNATVSLPAQWDSTILLSSGTTYWAAF